jgi:hypothetical protein
MKKRRKIIPAKDGYYKNHHYASQLEIRMAKVLDKENIGYIPHAKFVVDNNGKEREVDFMFYQLIKPYWSYQFIQGIEVKGWLSRRDWERRKELEDVGVYVFMGTPTMIDFWEQEGFTEHKIYKLDKKEETEYREAIKEYKMV